MPRLTYRPVSCLWSASIHPLSAPHCIAHQSPLPLAASPFVLLVLNLQRHTGNAPSQDDRGETYSVPGGQQEDGHEAGDGDTLASFGGELVVPAESGHGGAAETGAVDDTAAVVATPVHHPASAVVPEEELDGDEDSPATPTLADWEISEVRCGCEWILRTLITIWCQLLSTGSTSIDSFILPTASINSNSAAVTLIRFTDAPLKMEAPASSALFDTQLRKLRETLGCAYFSLRFVLCFAMLVLVHL